MKYHVQFMELDLENKLVEALGSDGVMILDGRNAIYNMKADAYKQFLKMNKNLHSYCGWRIKKGSRFDNSVVISEWIKPAANKHIQKE